MFNRIINRIREPERGRETPPTSPSRIGSTSESHDGTEADAAEGFLCPTCMENFASPEALQTHYMETHGDGELHTCPVCKGKFPTSDQLQIHYGTEHSSIKNGGLDTLKEEVAKLQTTLKEERGYSEDLKKEVARLSTAFSLGDKNDAIIQEADLLRIQLRAMEESKVLLTSEVVLLRKQLVEAVETNMNLKHKKEAVELKASELAEEHAFLKCKLDNEGTTRTMLENQLLEFQESNKNLEMQLHQRPAADDVLVLRTELVQVQTLMDQITRKGEQEKEGLLQEYQAIQSQYAKLLLQKDEVDTLLKESPKSEEIEMLREQIVQLTKDTDILKTSLASEKDGNKELNSKLKNHKDIIDEKDKQIEERNKDVLHFKSEMEKGNATKVAFAALQSSNEKTLKKCQKLESNISDMEAKLDGKMTEIKSLQMELSEMKQSFSDKLSFQQQQMMDCKKELAEALNICKRKESELDDVTKQLSTVQMHYQAQVSAVDDLNLQLLEFQSTKGEDERIKQNRDEKIAELESMIAEHKDTISRLEKERTSLFVEIEAGEGASAALQQLRTENAALIKKLEVQKSSAEQHAIESSKSLDSLHQQMQESKVQLQSTNAKCEKLQIRITELMEELSSSQAKGESLAQELKTREDALLIAEANFSECKNNFTSDLERKDDELKMIRKELDKACNESHEKTAASVNLEQRLNESEQNVEQLKSQCEMLTTTSEEKDATIHHKTGEINELKNSLELNIAKCAKLEENMNEMTVSWIDKIAEVEHKLKQVEIENVKLADENKSLADKETANKATFIALSADKDKLLKDIAAVQDDLRKRSKKVEEDNGVMLAMKVSLEEKSVDIEKLQSEILVLTKEKSDLDSDILILKTTLKETESELDSNQGSNKVFAETLQTVQHELTSAKTNMENMGVELLNSQEECNTFKTDLTQLRKTHEETVSKLRDVEKQLRETQSTVADRDMSLKQVSQQLKEIQVTEKLLTDSLKSSKESVANLENRVQELEARLLSTVADLESVVLQKTAVETELFNTQRSLSDADQKYSTLQLALNERKEKLAQERSAHDQEIAELHRVREVLITQKSELEDRISEAEDRLKKEIHNADLAKFEAEKEVAAFKSTLDEVSKQLESVTDAKTASEHEWERQKSCYVLQLGTLNENLGTLRSDLAVQQDKNEQLEKKVDELNGDKLELSATLENAMDERRALLERCLASEGECEKLRSVTSELRRKLDDALSGLHELGRENQTLQIEIAKLVGRKWADDGEVTNCTSCHNVFSITNRKHHCRHCGNIFCQDCSNKVATIASYKKPVRVCENCFNELGKN